MPKADRVFKEQKGGIEKRDYRLQIYCAVFDVVVLEEPIQEPSKTLCNHGCRDVEAGLDELPK